MVTTAQSSPSLRHTKSFIAPNMRFAKSSHVILSHPPRLLKVSWISFLLAPIQHRLTTPRNEEENCTALTDRRRLVVKRTKSEKMCVKRKNFFHPRLAQLSIETEIHSGKFHTAREAKHKVFMFSLLAAHLISCWRSHMRRQLLHNLNCLDDDDLRLRDSKRDCLSESITKRFTRQLATLATRFQWENAFKLELKQ